MQDQKQYEANYGITEKIPVTFLGYQETIDGVDLILVNDGVHNTNVYDPDKHIIVDFERL